VQVLQGSPLQDRFVALAKPALPPSMAVGCCGLAYMDVFTATRQGLYPTSEGGLWTLNDIQPRYIQTNHSSVVRPAKSLFWRKVSIMPEVLLGR